MPRFRSFPSRPFYSFSSTIKNLFEARDFLLSHDRRRNAPSLIPILTNVTRARFLVSGGGFSWFLSNEPPCTVLKGIPPFLIQSRIIAYEIGTRWIFSFFFSGLFTIILNNFMLLYYRRGINGINVERYWEVSVYFVFLLQYFL